MSKSADILILISAVSAGLIAFVMCEIAIRLRLNLDPVGPRSSHISATSRLGGISMTLGFSVSYLLWSIFGLSQIEVLFMILLVCVYGGMMIGLADDLFVLRASTKFLLQLALALAVSGFCGGLPAIPYPGGAITTGIWAIPLGVLWLIAFVNTFNFMDGVNGLASGTGLLALMIFALVMSLSGQNGDAMFFILLTAALAGFFLQNYHRGRIFLGDSGSHALGFVIAVCALERPAHYMLIAHPAQMIDPDTAARGGEMGLVIGLLFLPHIIDVTCTIIARAGKGEQVTSAHKDHFYQQLHQLGWRHQQIADCYIVFTAIGGFFVLLSVIWGPALLWVGLGFSGICYCLLMTKTLVLR